jgi:hypothetical protein
MMPRQTTHLALARPGARRQRGVATLVVVMVLFFVVAMVAAYTSRNLIFEQKTSANQYRSSIAFEAADAGVDWALAMLNGGLIDDNCSPSTATPGTSFQQRYLRITSNPPGPTGVNAAIAQNDRLAPFTPPAYAAPDPLDPSAYWPSCSLDGSAWGSSRTCRCPTSAAFAPAPATQPAFRVWLARPPTPASPEPAPLAGLFRLKVGGCTRMPAVDPSTRDCLDEDLDQPPPPGMTDANLSGNAIATLHVLVALRSGIASTPSAAITTQGDLAVSPTGAPLQIVNNLPALLNPITAHAGGTLPATGLKITALGLPPGTPDAATLLPGDTRLAGLGTLPAGVDPVLNSRMFVSQFGMKLGTYRDQPGVRSCPGFGVGACTAATLQTLLDTNPNRMLWVEGNLTLDADLGSTTAPVLLVVNGGSLTLAPNVTVVGLVYLVGTGAGPLQATLLAPSTGTSTIDGALVSGGNLQISHPAGAPVSPSGLKVSYNSAVLNLLRTTYGSWVRLPGGWRDFKGT